jgi:translation initiation factor IF-1
MSPYAFCLALGGVGLVAMAVSGLGSHAGHGHLGHGHAGHGHAGHGDSRHGAPGPTHGHAHEGGGLLRAAAVVSPRLWFTLLAGFGAAGLLLRPVAAGPLQAGLAVVGAVLLELVLARPLWNFAFRFASNPATTLEACVSDEVQAVTGFDREGHGLIAVELDGQVVQVLATLRAADRASGIRVRAGDRVRVEEVDAARNRCVVSALGS